MAASTSTGTIVGTGMEHKICIDSEIVVLAEGDGVVTSVDARHVTVKYDSGETKDYKLTKYLRSNHTTCINQRPIVDSEGNVLVYCGSDAKFSGGSSIWGGGTYTYKTENYLKYTFVMDGAGGDARRHDRLGDRRALPGRAEGPGGEF